jgi:hypothetical protein
MVEQVYIPSEYSEAQKSFDLLAGFTKKLYIWNFDQQQPGSQCCCWGGIWFTLAGNTV